MVECGGRKLRLKTYQKINLEQKDGKEVEYVHIYWPWSSRWRVKGYFLRDFDGLKKGDVSVMNRRERT